jgi:hypothetical protein
MNRPEQSLHLDVAELLTLYYPPGRSGVAWFHPPQGGKRGGKRNRAGVPIEAAILKGMGARAGVSDLVLMWCSGSAVIELKVDGRLSPAQREWMAWCELAGVPRFVCRSVAEVRGVVAHLVEGGMPAPRGWRANKPRRSRVLSD